MTKLDLINALWTEAGITKNEAAKLVNLFFDEMANALESGGKVEIRGFVPFMSRNTRGMLEGTRNPGKR